LKQPVAAAKPIQADEIEDLFRRHNRLLVQLLTARLGSAQAATEVAQEAYVRLLKLDEDRVISHQRAYLFKIAQNLASDRLRQRGNAKKTRELEFFEEEDAAADPERAAAADEELRFLLLVLKELPPKCQQAFRLHRFGGLSLGEVARQMALTERMIRIYVGRALA
jgi:RNA polymerase sigma-70 factor (ECF subfamily)